MEKLYSTYDDEIICHFFEAHELLEHESVILPCCFELLCDAAGQEPQRCGLVSGTLVLGREIDCRTPDSVDRRDEYMNLLCDDMDADLGYVVSALLENDGPLSIEETVCGIDHFYIDEVHAVDDALLPEILQVIPEMVFRHLHVYPELLSYYPEPLPHGDLRTEQDKQFEENAKKTHAAIMEMIFNGTYDKQNPQLTLTKEQMRVVQGMRQQGDSYPAEYIDKEHWETFLDAGFAEWNGTRVLYRFCDRGSEVV